MTGIYNTINSIDEKSSSDSEMASSDYDIEENSSEK